MLSKRDKWKKAGRVKKYRRQGMARKGKERLKCKQGKKKNAHNAEMQLLCHICFSLCISMSCFTLSCEAVPAGDSSRGWCSSGTEQLLWLKCWDKACPETFVPRWVSLSQQSAQYKRKTFAAEGCESRCPGFPPGSVWWVARQWAAQDRQQGSGAPWWSLLVLNNPVWFFKCHLH